MRINSKWIKDLNGGPESIKLLEKNIGSNLTDLGLSDVFVALTPRARETKEKKIGINQTKNLLRNKGKHHQIKKKKKPHQITKVTY